MIGEEDRDLLEGALKVAAERLPDDQREQMEEELRQREEEAKQTRDRVLTKVATVLCDYRKQAINDRAASHIEADWMEDEDAYEGVDNANRAEEGAQRPAKPTEGGGTPRRAPEDAEKSTVFMNITRPYTDAASARLGDMLLPTDDRAWKLEPTPVPDQVGNVPQEESMQPAGQGVAPNPMQQMQTVQAATQQTPGMAPGQMLTPGMPAQQPGAQPGGQMVPAPKTPLQQRIDEALKEVRRKVKNCERQIDDWLVECNFHREMRMVFDDSARMGTGILKGPVPTNRKVHKWVDGKLVKTREVAPISKRIDPWDCFPDLAAGENHQNGRFHWERDRITAKQLGELREEVLPVLGEDGNPLMELAIDESGMPKMQPVLRPSYFVDQINAVLREGPAKHTDAGRIDLPDFSGQEEAQYEIWYGYCTLNKEDLLALDCECEEDDEPMVSVMAVVVNDRVIKIVENPLDTGEFPYDYFVWNRRRGLPFGRGIPRLVRAPQRMLNGATRNMSDNAGLSAGIMLFLRRKGLVPADGNWKLHGRKIFFVDDEVKSASDAFGQATVDPRTNELKMVIDYALQMAEQITGMPLLLQGQMGNAPDTLGGQQLAMNNANGVLRRLAKQYDDSVTERHITRYYAWAQQYVDDDDLKCDAVVDARGSSALVERHIADQAIAQMGAFINDPEFEISKKRWIEEWMKSQRLDPERMKMTPEEIQARQQMQPPPPYQVQVAQMNNESRERIAQLVEENKKLLTKMESDAETYRALAQIAGDSAISGDELKVRIWEVLNSQRLARDHKVADLAMRSQEAQADRMARASEKSRNGLPPA